MTVVAADIAGFVEGGDVAIWVATANVECIPQTARSMGARVADGGERLWLFLPEEQGARTLANARPGAVLAATFVRLHDYRAVQIKGEVASKHVCGEDERTWPTDYLARFALANERVGMPRELIEHMVYWPCVAVEIIVREQFAQTPGPKAGERL